MNGHPIGLTGDITIPDWLRLIRAEYTEVSGLHLAKPQAQPLRFSGVPAATRTCGDR